MEPVIKMKCVDCGSEKEGLVCWTCAANKLPKNNDLFHVKRSKCLECGYDAPVWVDADEWVCTVCRRRHYGDDEE